MDVLLNEEQKKIREIIRRFAEEEIIPVASEWDKEHRWPSELLGKMGDMGLMGMPVPPEFGGSGTDYISYMIAVEELARAWAALSTIMTVHTSVGTLPILNFGTPDQKERFLKPLAGGKMIGAFALTESEAGSDASAVKTTAVKDGNDYILNGSKIFITNGSKAGCVIVFAVTDPEAGTGGYSALIVEKGMDGFTYGVEEDKMGMHSSVASELIFNEVRVPRENLLGREGEGLRIGLSALDGGRMGIAAQSVGIARAAFEESVKYSAERQQFGRPINRFQAISFMLADMATEIDAARGLVYRGALMKERGLRFSKEAAMAKLFASRAAMRTTTKAIQVHGGYGFTTDYPVERYFRDAKVTEIYEGTSEIMRLVISRNI